MPKGRIIMIEALSRWVEVLHQEGAVGLLNTHSNPFLPLHSHMHWVYFLFTSSLASMPAYHHSLSFLFMSSFWPLCALVEKKKWKQNINIKKCVLRKEALCVFLVDAISM